MLNRNKAEHKPITIDVDEESAIAPLETEKLLEKSSDLNSSSKSGLMPPSTMKMAEFAFSFFGLMISYVTWGVMQELIMNTKFSPTPLVPSGMFPSSKYECLFYSLFCCLQLILHENIGMLQPFHYHA